MPIEKYKDNIWGDICALLRLREELKLSIDFVSKFIDISRMDEWDRKKARDFILPMRQVAGRLDSLFGTFKKIVEAAAK